MTESVTQEPIELFPFKMFDRSDVSTEADFRALPGSVPVEDAEVPKEESAEPSLTADASTPPTPPVENQTPSATENVTVPPIVPIEPGTQSSSETKSISIGKMTPPAVVKT